jgi:hypothetical protein
MELMETRRWLNQHALSPALLILLFGASTAIHLQACAVSNMVKSLHGYPAFISDDLVVCRIRAVGFIQDHAWMPLTFALLALASLFWLGFRKAPRWAVWTTLGGLSLPCLAYMWICFKASTLGFFVMGPAT